MIPEVVKLAAKGGKKPLTYEDLSERLGISAEALRAIHRMSRNGATFQRLSEVLGVDDPTTIQALLTLCGRAEGIEETQRRHEQARAVATANREHQNRLRR